MVIKKSFFSFFGKKKKETNTELKIIKKIYILWLQGFDNAPFIIKKCLESWIVMNPTWEVVKLDNSNLKDYLIINDVVERFKKKEISKASFSDIIRISLLNKYGGLWVDATTFCIKPLDYWLLGQIQEGIFLFSNDVFAGRKPDRPIASWFIYGNKNNYIVSTWYKSVVEYYKKNKQIGNLEPASSLERWKKGDKENHYFWFHYLFQEIYEEDFIFKKIWDSVPKMLKTEAVFVQRKGMLNEINEEVRKHIDFKKSPLYKLTYRYDEKKYNAKTNLHYLLEPEYFNMGIASNRYKVKNPIPNIWLIHIGKCGGTAIRMFFKDQGINLNQFHTIKPVIESNRKYIIWLRNPIRRFVSAFYHSYELIHFDTSNIDINNLTIFNTLAPGRIKYKMQNNHTFSPEYDGLINYFKTANNLAESLSSTDIEVRTKANRLMNHPMEHIFKGLGWYLDNGDFVKNHNDKILFVGKVESMTEDLNKLSELLGISLNNSKKIRENKTKYDKHLSTLAIKNILEFYTSSDYEALKELHNKGWIDRKTYKSYFNV